MRPAVGSPVFTGTLNGKPLRFFPSPLNNGVDMPWHSVDDLHRCLDLPRELRRRFLQDLKSNWKGMSTTVATSTGIATIAPNHMALAFIGAAIDLGKAPAVFETRYAMEGGQALRALSGDLPEREGLEFALAAAQFALGRTNSASSGGAE